MDCAPLNLAHFHERRAEKFLRHHNFDDARKAIDCALLYLQDAYKCVRIPKAIEVLDTQKWDLERKLKQIQMRKLQYERGKHKEIIPKKKEAASVLTLTRPENSVTAQSVSKSIDKTIREMGTKLNSKEEQHIRQQSIPKQSKENNPKFSNNPVMADDENNVETRLKTTNSKHTNEHNDSAVDGNIDSNETSLSTNSDCDLPSLAPLELPAFDFDVFTTSAPPMMTTITGLAEGFQK